MPCPVYKLGAVGWEDCCLGMDWSSVSSWWPSVLYLTCSYWVLSLSLLAGAPHQKCSHVSLHVNKWFRSGSPPPAKCCAHWGWTKFQCLCWHAVHPYWPVAVNSLSAQSCMPSPSGRNIPGSSLHINPLLFPGPLNCVGGNPFSFPSRLFPLPTLETISVSLCLEMDGPYFVICEPHHDECGTELLRQCPKAGLNHGD